MINDTVMKLAEKGQPIPPELFTEPAARPRSDLRRGIKLLTVGLAIIIAIYRNRKTPLVDEYDQMSR